MFLLYIFYIWLEIPVSSETVVIVVHLVQINLCRSRVSAVSAPCAGAERVSLRRGLSWWTIDHLYQTFLSIRGTASESTNQCRSVTQCCFKSPYIWLFSVHVDSGLTGFIHKVQLEEALCGGVLRRRLLFLRNLVMLQRSRLFKTQESEILLRSVSVLLLYFFSLKLTWKTQLCSCCTLSSAFVYSHS